MMARRRLPYRFTQPPQRVRKAKLDNLALVPGSMLSHIASCQETANKLPRNGVLIVLPAVNSAQKQILLLVAKLLAAEGHQVRVMPAEEVSHASRYVASKRDC